MKKRLLLLSVLTLFLHATSWAYSFAVANDDGVTIYYNISGSEATVTYKSTSYNSYSGTVVIPETVTYNGSTYSVTTIGERAFYKCSGMTQVTIGKNVKTIGYAAFGYCSDLTQLEVAKGNQYFCAVDGVLYSKDMTTVVQFPPSSPLPSSYDIPESVTEIGDYAFYYCTGLTEVTIPNGVTAIGDRAFDGCSGLTEITIPGSVTTMGGSVFCNCTGLTQVTIGYGITTIGTYAFDKCSGLTEVTIPGSVTTLNNYAFYYCTGLTQVTIPESVTIVGSSAFYYCPSLTSIYSLNPEPPTCSGSSVFYKVDTSACTLYVPEGSKGAYSTANQWKEFFNIVEMDMAQVNSITAGGNAEAVGYYTTDGKSVSQSQRGINILRYSDGTVRKVLVK